MNSCIRMMHSRPVYGAFGKSATAHFTGGLGVSLNKQIADVGPRIHCLPKLQATEAGSALTAGRGRSRVSSSCGAAAPRTENMQPARVETVNDVY